MMRVEVAGVGLGELPAGGEEDEPSAVYGLADDHDLHVAVAQVFHSRVIAARINARLNSGLCRAARL